VVVPQYGGVNVSDPTSQGSFDPTTLENYALGEASFAEGDLVRSEATKTLGFRPPKASVKTVQNTQVLTITARDTDKNRVAKEANAYAAGYLAARRSSSQSLNQSLIKELQAQINVFHSQQLQYPPLDGRRTALGGQINELENGIATLNTSNAVNVHPGAFIAAARVPGAPETPRLGFDLGLGIVLGLLIGLGGAFLWDRLDDRIKTKRDLETATGGLATIGVVPLVKDWREEGQSRIMSLENPYSPAAEAYGTIRTSLQIYGVQHPLGVVAVTSAKAGEGKSSTVANLGVAFARSGRRTVVVCGDLRRPRLHEYFGEENIKGFTNVLIGEVPLATALRPVEAVPGLSLLAAGPPAPNPAELLSSPGSRTVFEQLRRDFDIVLVDCTPVLPVPDSLELSTLVDGMVLIVGARRLDRREVARTLEVLGQVEAPLIGTVLNQVTRADVEEGYSSYAFGYAPYAPRDKDAVSTNGGGVATSAQGDVPVGHNGGQVPSAAPFVSEHGVDD
jgi:capsular exopolysaccharide synthesis family protein